MEPAEPIRVSAVYALADRQVIVNLALPRGATVTDVVRASGLRNRFPEIPDPAPCAVFGHAVAADYVVRAGDRVEILRPLLVDPKEGRRRAAASAGAKKSIRN